MNNPLRFNDPSGEFIPLLIIGGIALAGAINVAVNWDNIDNIGQGFAYFGVGAIGGFFMMNGNVVGGGAFIAAGNSILTQGFDNGFNNVDFGQVGMSAVIGGGTAYLGRGLSKVLQSPISGLYSSVKGEALRQGLTLGTNSAATGFVMGTGLSLASGQDFEAAASTGGKSAVLGFGIGFTTGAYQGYLNAKSKGVNPWSGKPQLRENYVRDVNALKLIDAEMKAKGFSEEQRAIELHRMRRELGIEYKNKTPGYLLDEIYKRNMMKYGDKYGPTIDFLRRHNKSWGEIIKGSYTPGGKDFNF